MSAHAPSARHTAAAFLVGLLLGTAFVAPVLPRVVAALPVPSSVSSVGVVLLVGVLAIVAFVLGLAAIYVGLALVERR